MRIKSVNFLLLTSYFLLCLSAFGDNTMVVNPDNRPVPVKITSGSVTVTGGDASAANQTAVQANPGSDASKAVAVQGVTGGKAVATAEASAQLTPTITTVTTSGTVAAGARKLTFVFSSDFAGTVLTATFAGANDASISLDAPTPNTLAAVAYTVTAGTIRIVKVQ
jgi:hypothetical protein